MKNKDFENILSEASEESRERVKQFTDALDVVKESERSPQDFSIPVRPFKGQDYWGGKRQGVILVEKEEDIDPLWVLLMAQDDYWEYHKGIIKVAPKEIGSIGELSQLCGYVGKTDIYDVEAIRAKIPFIIYQENSY